MTRSALAAGALALSLFTTGCVAGTSTQSAAAPADDQPFEGQVEFWTINLKKNYSDYITGLIGQYQKEHPKVTINWVDVPGAESATKLLAAVASGEVPDAVNVNSVELGRFVPSLEPLDAYFGQAELADFQPNLVDPLRMDGKLYAVPWYNGGAPVAMYRKSVVSKAGFDDKAPPTSFAEALALADKVYDKTKINGTNTISDHTALRYHGVSLLSEDKKKAAFNTPEALAVLETYKKSYDKHGIAPGAISKDVRNMPQTPGERPAGLHPARRNAAQLLNIQKNAPDVYKDLVVTEPVKIELRQLPAARPAGLRHPQGLRAQEGRRRVHQVLHQRRQPAGLLQDRADLPVHGLLDQGPLLHRGRRRRPDGRRPPGDRQGAAQAGVQPARHEQGRRARRIPERRGQSLPPGLQERRGGARRRRETME